MENRNEVVIGSVVRSLAGKDRGRLYVACRISDRRVYAADGKRHKLLDPKPKNPRHISPSLGRIDLTGLTDKKLRRTLGAFTDPERAGEKDRD